VQTAEDLPVMAGHGGLAVLGRGCHPKLPFPDPTAHYNWSWYERVSLCRWDH